MPSGFADENRGRPSGRIGQACMDLYLYAPATPRCRTHWIGPRARAGCASSGRGAAKRGPDFVRKSARSWCAVATNVEARRDHFATHSIITQQQVFVVRARTKAASDRLSPSVCGVHFARKLTRTRFGIQRPDWGALRLTRVVHIIQGVRNAFLEPVPIHHACCTEAWWTGPLDSRIVSPAS